MSRRLLWIVAALAVVVVVAVGITQAGSNDAPKATPNSFDLQAARERLAGAPPPLAALHAQANVLLPGSKRNVRARLDALKGHPVVLNKWASWCQPCRAEFPLLQQASVRFGKRVAFIGLDSGDGDGDAAKAFLAKFPLTYPTYVDVNARTAAALGAGGGYPTTVFYDASGRQTFVHQGLYSDQGRLDADIAHFALGQP
jgi:cytochrome c biogenesis protein CcmG/thiol:disulfide interchange protein DsbE